MRSTNKKMVMSKDMAKVGKEVWEKKGTIYFTKFSLRHAAM